MAKKVSRSSIAAVKTLLQDTGTPVQMKRQIALAHGVAWDDVKSANSGKIYKLIEAKWAGKVDTDFSEADLANLPPLPMPTVPVPPPAATAATTAATAATPPAGTATTPPPPPPPPSLSWRDWLKQLNKALQPLYAVIELLIEIAALIVLGAGALGSGNPLFFVAFVLVAAQMLVSLLRR